MMLKTLDEAESFVLNTEGFMWDGWNIIRLVQDDYAEYLPIGVFNREDGKWYRKTVFPCHDGCWEIPDTAAK